MPAMDDGGGRSRTAVGVWLLACCVLIFAMVVLGGVTRLTRSGLSIVNWQPIMGIIPPLSDSAWQRAFEQYQQFPEYQSVNRGMQFTAFKRIFWVEYAHRLLGRLIGLVFLVPLLVFAFGRRLDRRLAGRLGAIFVLGGLQGALGWYMVRSGLVADPRVSQYRLAAHLIMAVALYGAILWTALGLFDRRARPGAPCQRRWLAVAAGAVPIMMLSGAFVAGTHAGYIMNTFPTMNGAWLPAQAFTMAPWWRDLFENTVTIQFLHRAGALLVTLLVLAATLPILTRQPAAGLRPRAGWLLAALGLQLTLGITTLLLRVPVAVAAAHQAGALLLFSAALFALHGARRTARSNPVGGTGHQP